MREKYDYIDIDPFGTPIYFLNNAIKNIKNKGLLSVTATDTSLLCGTYPEKCKIRYWSKPIHNYLMHEIGLRILIRKIQLIGIQFEKALIPILSYSLDHYMKIFLKCIHSKKKCKEIYNNFKEINYEKQEYFFVKRGEYGPVYDGKLFEKELIKKIIKNKIKYNYMLDKKLEKFLKIIEKESEINGKIYNTHQIAKEFKKEIPKEKILFEKAEKNKIKITKSHLGKNNYRSESSLKKILKLFD